MIEENIFTVEVCDQGKGIENIEEAMCPMYTTRPDQDRSGMGICVYGGVYGQRGSRV